MELQELDQKGSPHLEARWIGGNASLFSLKDMQESWEGLRGRQAFSNVNNGGERGEKISSRVREPLGKKAP